MKEIRRWDVMVRLIQQNGFSTFVEIGTKEGRTTHRVLQKTNAKVIACDPWQSQPQNAGKECGETYDKWHFAGIKTEFWQSVGAWKDRLEFYRENSEQLAERIEDESIDLVFLDGAHDYDSVKLDIDLYWQKVRSGGILSGHDWQNSFPTVKRAVSERFDDIELEEDLVWWVRK